MLAKSYVMYSVRYIQILYVCRYVADCGVEGGVSKECLEQRIRRLEPLYMYV